jgi:hypothetical protein
MNRRRDRFLLLRPLRQVSLLLLLLAGLPGRAAAAGPAPSLADWSLPTSLDQVSTTHLIQLAIIVGAIAMFLMFRARNK